jgi:hypothetical protein
VTLCGVEDGANVLKERDVSIHGDNAEDTQRVTPRRCCVSTYTRRHMPEDHISNTDTITFNIV